MIRAIEMQKNTSALRLDVAPANNFAMFRTSRGSFPDNHGA
jgi:hypothetical protein